ncbi:MAG: 6-carboxytetrahydropterin synthase, partial [Planctomycetia bacterium]|nr:6-carboxytetrahydropterin synthase [Planctomycetia bacterium]
MEHYTVRLRHDTFSFSACHMLAFHSDDHRETTVEPLHGHDFTASIEIAGPLDQNGCVVDFVDVSSMFRQILDEFDHRILLADSSDTLPLHLDEEGNIVVSFANGKQTKRWLFPQSDVLVLHASTATTELIAFDLLERFRKRFFSRFNQGHSTNKYSFKIELEESNGCSA